MSANAYHNAMNAYQTSQANAMGGFDIAVELYKGIIKNIREAKSAYQSGKLDRMCELNAKTYKILEALQLHLNREDPAAQEQTEFLDKFYTDIFKALSQNIMSDDPEKGFDKILNAIQPVYEMWCQHAANARASDSSKVN